MFFSPVRPSVLTKPVFTTTENEDLFETLSTMDKFEKSDLELYENADVTTVMCVCSTVCLPFLRIREWFVWTAKTTQRQRQRSVDGKHLLPYRSKNGQIYPD